MKILKILTLKVNGLPSTLEEGSEKNEQFKKLVQDQKAQILCLIGTAIDYQPVKILQDIYTQVAWTPGRRISGNTGLCSGGLVIYHTSDVSVWPESENLNSCPCIHFCKHDRYFRTVTFFFGGNRFRLCLIQMSPENTSYYVVKRIMQNYAYMGNKTIFVGHFGAHTGTSSIDWPDRPRRSVDLHNGTRMRGEKLMRFLSRQLREQSLVILNGRAEPDHGEGGQPTLQGTRGQGVVDYALVHRDRFNDYEFKVIAIERFEHRPIMVTIKDNSRVGGDLTTTEDDNDIARINGLVVVRMVSNMLKNIGVTCEELELGIDTAEASTPKDDDKNAPNKWKTDLGQIMRDLKSALLTAKKQTCDSSNIDEAVTFTDNVDEYYDDSDEEKEEYDCEEIEKKMDEKTVTTGEQLQKPSTSREPPKEHGTQAQEELSGGLHNVSLSSTNRRDDE